MVVINEIVPIKKSTKVMVGIRPEYIRATEENGMKYQKGKVHLREDLGGEDIIYLDVGGARLIMVMTGESGRKYDVDDIMHIEIDGTSLYLFDGISGKRIGRGTGNPNV